MSFFQNIYKQLTKLFVSTTEKSESTPNVNKSLPDTIPVKQTMQFCVPSEHKQLLNRLERVLKVEYKNFFEEWGLEKSLGYPINLVFSIPAFALKILEKIPDKDIVIATRAILFGISHCPNCDSAITPSIKRCPQCNSEIPQDSIYIKGIDVLSVSIDTKELLTTILCKFFYINGAIKNLDIVSKVEDSVMSEIITSLSHEVKVCPDCGFAIVPASAKYCWNCGSKLEKSANHSEETLIITLPLNEYVISALNKLALEKIKEIDEIDFDGQVVIQDFCDVMIENEIATAQLCKKVGALFAKLEEYETAIHYYQTAMDIDSELDLSIQIERLEKKIYN